MSLIIFLISSFVFVFIPGKTVQVIALLSAVFKKKGDRRDKQQILQIKMDERTVEPALIIW